MEDLDCQVLDYLVQEAKREMLVRKVNKEIPEPMVYRELQDCLALMEDLVCQVPKVPKVPQVRKEILEKVDNLVQEAKKEIPERETLVRKVNKEILEQMVYRELQEETVYQDQSECPDLPDCQVVMDFQDKKENEGSLEKKEIQVNKVKKEPKVP